MSNQKVIKPIFLYFAILTFVQLAQPFTLLAQEQWPGGTAGVGGSYTNTYTPHSGAMAYPAFHYQRPRDEIASLPPVDVSMVFC